MPLEECYTSKVCNEPGEIASGNIHPTEPNYNKSLTKKDELEVPNSKDASLIGSTTPTSFRKGKIQVNNISLTKETEEDQGQTNNISLTKKKRGRPKGKKNRKSPSGSLVPVTECRKGKIYPIVAGDRAPKSEAYNHPNHYNWLYQWSIWDGQKWRTKSKRVQSNQVHYIKYLISCEKPITEILKHL
ncbi:MAG: hypothetical protein F6K24_13250 [Okeania sp. SIO2D1]|nr:hypothetical protein [Okeania sp. SIO2D1]